MKLIAFLDQKFGFGELLTFFEILLPLRILEYIETAVNSSFANKFGIMFARKLDI